MRPSDEPTAFPSSEGYATGYGAGELLEGAFLLGLPTGTGVLERSEARCLLTRQLGHVIFAAF